MTDESRPIAIRLSDTLLSRIDTVAERHRWNRNQAIRVLIEYAMAQTENNAALLLAGPETEQE